MNLLSNSGFILNISSIFCDLSYVNVWFWWSDLILLAYTFPLKPIVRHLSYNFYDFKINFLSLPISWWNNSEVSIILYLSLSKTPSDIVFCYKSEFTTETASRKWSIFHQLPWSVIFTSNWKYSSGSSKLKLL